MIHTFPDTNFDLQQIADSGQCFRWDVVDPFDLTYQIPVYDRRYIVLHEYNEVLASVAGVHGVEAQQHEIWLSHYFDMDTDYGHIISIIPEDDEYMQAAASKFSGIRILRQDPWEVFISFIISQNNNIPRIKNSIRALCLDNDGVFPRRWELARMDLSKYGLGYRQQYIEEFLSSQKSYLPPSGSTYKDAMEYYQHFKGIGPKVANCICLYGLHYLEACPIDTWMKKIVNTRYKGRIPEWVRSSYAGVYQQYCFCYERYLERSRDRK